MTYVQNASPIEKLRVTGRKSVSDAELLSIVLGKDVLFCHQFLEKNSRLLREVGKMSVEALAAHDGIGTITAAKILAALELGNRSHWEDTRERPQIITSRDAYNLVAPLLMDIQKEEFWCLFLNRNSRVIGREQLSIGGITGTIVDARIIFKRALEHNATALVLAHNHPSGSYAPSQSDLDITRKLVRSGEAIDISVLDHIIVGEHGYYSFADEGQL